MQTTEGIIGLTGPKGVGKSTYAAQLLFTLYAKDGMCDGQILSFASPIKEMLLCIVDKEYLDDKEKIIPTLGVSARACLQSLGTEWGRELCPEIWLNITKDRILNSKKTLTIIDDVRFDNEAEMIRSLGGQIWRLSRKGVGGKDKHISEAGISDYLVNVEIKLDEEKKTVEKKDPPKADEQKASIRISEVHETPTGLS